LNSLSTGVLFFSGISVAGFNPPAKNILYIEREGKKDG
jgi:hypothetical protein